MYTFQLYYIRQPSLGGGDGGAKSLVGDIGLGSLAWDIYLELARACHVFVFSPSASCSVKLSSNLSEQAVQHCKLKKLLLV